MVRKIGKEKYWSKNGWSVNISEVWDGHLSRKVYQVANDIGIVVRVKRESEISGCEPLVPQCI